MKRREFFTLLGSIVATSTPAWPLAARAQQAAVPVVGFLSSRAASETVTLSAAFREGLNDAGFAEGRNVAVEYRWADGRYDQLAQLAAELVSRRVAVIVTGGGAVTAIAAKAATQAIPIVFSGGSDPVGTGLVASLSRPGGNMTGVLNIASELTAKRLEFLLELLPAGSKVAALRNPGSPEAAMHIREVEDAARLSGRQIMIATARTEAEFESAVTGLSSQQVRGILIANDPFFASKRERLVAVITQNRIPAIYPQREYAEAGGLMSYGTNFSDIYRQVGIYAGRILKGEKPADLPVMRPTRFELVINRKTAAAQGIELPNKLIALADDVID
jgi:putative ABC transport system substrate-binding protein